jgi:sec-independent protein translocase protein TatC
MRAYRKLAIVVILIVSAVLTPPDIMSQILIAMPLVFLYEISIYVSAFMLRKERKRELAALKALEAREAAAERQALKEKEREEEQVPLDQRLLD